MSDEMTEEPMIETPADFGHFLLEKELGHGGMGGVYLARDKMLDRKVAIKVMLKELGSDPKFVERFQREAQAAARLNHPNIAQIYSFGQEQGMPYIAMELVSGGSLDKDMEASPGDLDQVRVMRIGQQMVDALALAADQGLVHGDVKPENVLYAEDGTAKLVDFGLAAMQGDSSEIWGTPYYISPEKCRRQKIDFRADIYSLGGTLYHALTGQPPFEGEDANAVVRARFEGAPPKPSEVRHDLSPEVDAIIMRMLELEPAMRYPTYQSLMGDIKRYLAKAGPATTSGKLGGPRVRIKGRKPKMQLPGAEGNDSIAVLDGDADLTPADEAEEKHMNLGLVVGGVAAGIVLLILLVAGGLWWYVHAEKVGEEKAAKAEIVGKMNEGRAAIETTRNAIQNFGANFKELVDKCDKEIAGVVQDIKGFLPEELREPARAFLSLPPTADVAEAISYTNSLLSAKQPAAEAKPAEAEKKDSKDLKDPKDPKDLKDLKDLKAEKKPAEEEKKPEVELPMAVRQIADLWKDVYFFRASNMRVQAHVIKLLQLAETVSGMTAEDKETVEKIGELSRLLKDGLGTLRAEKFVELTQRRAGDFRRKAGTLVKAAQQQIARAKAKAEQAAKEAAEKAAKEEAETKAAEERKAKIEEETALAQSTFDGLVGLRLKTLDWDRALKELQRVMGEMTTLEGKDYMRTQQKKVECMKALHQLFISKAKGFQFKSGRAVTATVTAADAKSITIQGQRMVRGKAVADGEPKKLDWTRFFGKKEHVGYMNQMINQLVMNGRETVKTSARAWSEQMFGAALALQLLYSEVEGAAEFAPTLVKKAAADFEPSRKWAKKLFPEIDVGEVVE
ncbi:MAG: serine/threonine protein kinase [Kiritimatiellae bacterium]|nr:serine/threonine protein kinase [Kiritimatiellia bacterium]